MSSVTALASTLTSGINDVQSSIKNVATQLATNKKTLDPSQSGIVTRLSSQVSGYDSASGNITAGQNVISVAQTGLSSISDILTQMQTLANKANSSTLSATDASSLNATFQNLLTQVTDLASSADVNGSNLLKASATAMTVQTGLLSTDTTTVAAHDSSATGLSINALTITTASAAAAAITALGTALTSVSASQSALSADGAGLISRGKTVASISTNLQSTIDSIQKPDAAALQIQLTQLNGQQSIDYYLISQMNTASQAMLTIFR